MKAFTKHALALGIVATLGGVASAPAQATVMGTSLVDLTGFVINTRDSTDTPQGILDATGASLNINNPNNSASGDLSFLTFTSTGSYSGTYPGTLGYNLASSAAPVNLPAVCVGSGCNPLSPDNTFPLLSGPPTGGYSASDQNEQGAPVTGIPGFSTPASVTAESASALTTDQGLATSKASNTLNSSFIFKPLTDLSLQMDFDMLVYLQVEVTVDETFPGFANASFNVSFTITDITTASAPVQVWSYTPTVRDNATNGIMSTISLSAPLLASTQIIQNSGTDAYLSDWTPLLLAGRVYQLSADEKTEVNVQRVNAIPEPGVLGMLAIGALGLGAVRRRRSTRA